MPRNIETLDDQPIEDRTPNFAGGLATYPPRAALAENVFSLGENTMLTKLGEVQTRRGWEQVGAPLHPQGGTQQGAGFLHTSAVKKLIIFINASGGGTVAGYAWDGAAWSAALAWAPTVTGPVDIVQGIDNLYITNGTDNMRSWDGAAFVDLGGGATDAPKAKYIVWGTSRLIAAGIAGAADTVAFSNILNPGPAQWPANQRIRVGGDGEPITGIAMWTEMLLVVFKRSRSFVVNIDPVNTVATFPIKEVPAAVGCVAHRSIARVGRDLWFVAPDGLRSLSRVLQGAETDIGEPLSLPLANVTGLIKEENYASMCATYFQGHFLWAFITDANLPTERPNLLVFNVPLKTWEGRWRVPAGHHPRLFVRTQFTEGERLMALVVSSEVLRWRHWNTESEEVVADYEDSSILAGGAQAIATRITTRGHSFSTAKNDKRGFVLEVEFGTSTAATVTVGRILNDEAAVATSDAVVPAGRVPLTLLHTAPFRALAIDLQTTSKKLAVRSLTLTAFLRTMPVGQ